MKIGILTFHYMINPGSVLQAYCVYKLLKQSLADAHIEIINLMPTLRTQNEQRFLYKKPPFINLPKIFKYRTIRSFLYKNIPHSPICNNDTLEEQVIFINQQNYDYIFTGSDTVWMHSKKFNYQLPHIYFLPEGITAKKISIAASVDPLNDADAYYEKKEELSQIFNSYEKITVRDRFSKELINNLGAGNVMEIADPTILYDFEAVLEIPLNKTRPIAKKNVLIHIPDKRLNKMIEEWLKSTGNYHFIKEDARFWKYDYIEDFLKNFRKIDILITDRFHRSIFAIKLTNALVVNIERFSKNSLQISKGRDLFGKLNISDFCLRFDNNPDELKGNILSLIERWGQNDFFEREKNFQNYKTENLRKWSEIVMALKV